MTYTTIDGVVLDLSNLSVEQSAYLQHCWTALKEGATWEQMQDLLRTRQNPLLRDTGGVITASVYAHPLYRAVLDMENRAGIRDGMLRWEETIEDPFADEWVSVAQAAELAGVTRQAIHYAVQRGELIADTSGKQTVSVRSLSQWKPQAVRQKAGLERKNRQESNDR